MRKHLSAAGIVGFLLLSINTQVASAQSDPRKIELGGQFVLMRQSINLRRFFSSAPSRWDPGFGGRITYDATHILSLEAELNFLPRENDSFLNRGRKTQGLFGIKVGHRGDKLGVFGKVRPGLMRFSRVSDCPGNDRLSCGQFTHNEFAMDLGGVVEYYPSPRSVLRIDVGDTIINFRDRTEFQFAELPAFAHRIEGGLAHNLQLNIGIGIRF